MGQAPLRTHRRNFPLVAQHRQLGTAIRRAVSRQELGRRVGGYYALAVKASSINSFTCSTPAISRDVSAWVSPLAVVRTNVAVLIGKAELKIIVSTTIMPPAIPTWIQLAHSK